MRIIILFLLTINIVLAQSLRPGSVQGWHLNKTAKDTIRAAIHDTSTVLRSDWRADISDSSKIAIISDTTELKRRVIGDGKTVYLKQLSSTNSNGGGYLIARSAAFCQTILGDSTVDGGIVYAHPTTGMRYIRADAVDSWGRGHLLVTWYGAYGDSTNATITRRAIQKAITAGFASGNNWYKREVIFPEGTFLVDSTMRIFPNSYGGVRGHSKIVCTDKNKTILVGYTYDSHIDNTGTIYIYNLTLEGAGGYDASVSPGSGSGSGGIDINYSGGSTWLKEVIFDNVTAKNIMREALQIKDAYHGEIRNCYVENCNFDAYNIANVKSLRLINCRAKKVVHGIEVYTKDKNISAGTNDGSYLLIDNFDGEGMYSDGCVIMGGNNILITNSHFNFYDTTSSVTTANDGIRIECSYNAVKSLEISHTVIDSAIMNGIDLKNATYIPDITNINNCSIMNSNRAGIKVTYNITDENIVIRGNNIIDYNRQHGNGTIYSGVYTSSDHTVIDDNIIYFSDTTGTSLTWGYQPVFIYWNTDSVVVKNNNFKSPDGRDNQIVLYHTTNLGNYYIYNNRGLGFHNAIGLYYGSSTYYQQGFQGVGGYYTSTFKGRVAFSTRVINGDSLCVVKYNSSGAAVDTSTRINR